MGNRFRGRLGLGPAVRRTRRARIEFRQCILTGRTSAFSAPLRETFRMDWLVDGLEPQKTAGRRRSSQNLLPIKICHREPGSEGVATQLTFQMGGRAEPRHDNLLGF
jgi:hypothetical protein